MSAEGPREESDPEPVDTRRNILALGGDLALFMLGLSFASQTTVLPAFAAGLGASNLVIGAIPAVMTLGWFVPSLFAAGYTETLPRRLPFVLRWTIWERVPYALLALTAFFVAGPAPGLALAALLVLLLLTTGIGGVLMPAWMDIVGRTIPGRLRGRFFGITSLAGSAGGMLGSAFTAWILAVAPAPHGYGWCFVACTICMALSFWALTLAREPSVGAPAPAVTLGAYLRRIPGLLRRDADFSWFLVARSAIAAGGMATGFYTVFALRGLSAEAWHVGLFSAALFLGQSVGNLVLGWLADRAGHKLVLMIGALALVIANGVALAAPSLDAFSLVFALAGVQHASVSVSNLNALLEFAPRPEERPTYVGLGLTAQGPVVFAAPLVAGALVDVVGFRAVFGLASALSVVAVALFATRVRDPRAARRA